MSALAHGRSAEGEEAEALPASDGLGARLRRAANRSLVRRFARRPVALPHDFPPTVSFTFDDAPASALDAGLPVLDAAGMRATWYIACGLLGKPSPVGLILSAEGVMRLHATGHEIGDHTCSHLDARAVSSADYASDMAANRAALARLVPGLSTTSFAYPYGQATLGAKRAAQAGAATCRGTGTAIARGVLDLAMLPATPLYSGATPMQAIESLIVDVAHGGGWLIFYTHDVAPEPSPWGCTPAYFDATVTAVLRAGVRVRTIGAVAAEIAGASA